MIEGIAHSSLLHLLQSGTLTKLFDGTITHFYIGLLQFSVFNHIIILGLRHSNKVGYCKKKIDLLLWI